MDRTRDRRKPRCDATPGTDLARQSFVILSVVALGYALLAGLRTAADYDLGWQLATGDGSRSTTRSPRPTSFPTPRRDSPGSTR